MIKAERHDRIMAELARRGAIGVQELAALLDASSATIRRDIAELDATNALLSTHGVVIRQQRAIGTDGAHLKLRLADHECEFEAIAFRMGGLADKLPERVDVAYQLELNEWQGQVRLQLVVQDIQPAR